MEDISRAFLNADHFDEGSGAECVLGGVSDDEGLASAVRASIEQWESERDAEYKAALHASCEQKRSAELDLQAALRASREEQSMEPRNEAEESMQMAAAIAASLNNGTNSVARGKRVALADGDDDDEKERVRAARLRRLER